MKKIMLAIALIILVSVFCYAESCKDSGLEKEYKSDEGNCTYQTRTCCTNGEWSDWGEDCSSADCVSGQESTEDCGPCEIKECDYYGHWGKCKSIWELGRYDLIYGKYKAACCASIDAYEEGAHWPLAKTEYPNASRCYPTRCIYYSDFRWCGSWNDLPDCPYSFNSLNPSDIQRHTDCFDEDTIDSYVKRNIGKYEIGYYCRLAVGKNDYGEPNYEIWQCK